MSPDPHATAGLVVDWGMAPYVHVEGLGKGFAGDGSGPLTWVFRGLALQAAAGETVHLCGPSGAGKSTVLNLLAGLLRPDEGAVRVGSLLVSALGESARDRFRAHHVGYIYQTFNLLAALSVRENLLVPQGLMGHPIGRGSARFAAAEVLLERLGIAAHARKRPAALSVGQRQRVAVARALIHSPQLVLADEPTASLDEETAAVVAAVLAEQTARGAVLVYASHDPVLVTRLGGRTVALTTYGGA